MTIKTVLDILQILVIFFGFTFGIYKIGIFTHKIESSLNAHERRINILEKLFIKEKLKNMEVSNELLEKL